MVKINGCVNVLVVAIMQLRCAEAPVIGDVREESEQNRTVESEVTYDFLTVNSFRALEI